MEFFSYFEEGTGLLLLIAGLLVVFGLLALLVIRSSKREYAGRILFPVLFLEVAALFVVLVLGFPVGGGGEVGPQIVPLLWIAGMTGLAILLIVRVFAHAEEVDPPWGNIGKVAVMVGATILYLVLMRYLGYTVMTLAYVLFGMHYLGYRKWKVMVSVAVVWVAVAYAAFYRLLYVPLPTGLLFDRIFG